MAPCHEQPEGSMKAGRRGYPARSGVGWLLAKCCCCCSCKGRWGPGVRGAVPRGAGAGAGGPCGALGRAASPPPPARSAPGTSGGKGKGQGKADSGRARRPAAGLAERVRPGHPPPPPLRGRPPRRLRGRPRAPRQLVRRRPPLRASPPHWLPSRLVGVAAAGPARTGSPRGGREGEGRPISSSPLIGLAGPRGRASLPERLRHWPSGRPRGARPAPASVTRRGAYSGRRGAAWSVSGDGGGRGRAVRFPGGAPPRRAGRRRRRDKYGTAGGGLCWAGGLGRL